MRWSPGTTATLTVSYTDDDGNPLDPTSVVADIFDPNDVHEVVAAVAEHVSLGLYLYEYDIAPDAELGLWRVEWTAVVSGEDVLGGEMFEVNPIGVNVNFSSEINSSILRSRLGEPSDEIFDDAAITDLISYADGDLDLATLEGWKRKMARYARLVDVIESGSDRKMSQKFKQAKIMVDVWSDIIGAGEDAHASAMMGRVVGRVVNLRCTDNEAPLTPFSGYADHIREYPTHRLLLPAILA
jgi:hypothetical protein